MFEGRRVAYNAMWLNKFGRERFPIASEAEKDTFASIKEETAGGKGGVNLIAGVP